ncbi:MAG: MaoC family dehydratase N-terminal domain-containing protein [Pseudomonadota bacterium]
MRLTDEIRKYIGMKSEVQRACDPVETGAVRRYAQAIMDDDPIYMSKEVAAGTRYKQPVAPPLFPNAMMRLPFGEPDVIQARANDPDFDEASGSRLLGLLPLPIAHTSQLNGGSETELIRYARHGEWVDVQLCYRDIYERETSKGWMLFIVVETSYFGEDGKLIMRLRETQIRR